MEDRWEPVGNNDLRYDDTPQGGFTYVALRDADDHNVIIINEDDVVLLWERLGRTIRERGLV